MYVSSRCRLIAECRDGMDSCPLSDTRCPVSTDIFHLEINGDTLRHLLSWASFPILILSPGAALMAVWSKELPLTTRCLSPLHRFESRRPGHVRKLPVTLR